MRESITVNDGCGRVVNIMKIKSLWEKLTFLTLLMGLNSVSLSADLKINGIANYQELNKEYYIGALLLEDPLTTESEITAYKDRKQMKLLVTASRWSARLWQQQWQNNIAINNNILTDEPRLQQDLAFFTSFLKGKLIKGDELVIDYTPGKGTHIRLNNYPVIKTGNDKIFNYLLNTWVGRLPPSREFKHRILNLTPDAATRESIRLLDGNTLSEERIELVSQWYQAPNKKLLLATNKQKEAIKKSNKLAKQNKQKEDRNSKRKEMAKIENKNKLIKKNQLAKEKLERLKRETQAEQARVKREKAEKAARIAKLKMAKVQKKKEAQLEQYYYKDLYQWQLRQAIQGEVSYPAWAKQFSQEGIIEAQFTINRKGKVKSVSLLDLAAPKMLGAEVDKAIRKAGLMTLPPKQLLGKSWSFTVTYQFNLKTKKQKLLSSPNKPKHMLTSEGKRDTRVVSEYMTKVRDKVIAALKYPSEAVLLKKRGKASVFVTLDQQGKIVKVFEKFKAKHAILTKALSNAVNRAKPFPVMPAGIAKDKITVDISYNFSR